MKRIILIKEDDRREKELERRHIEGLKTKWRRRQKLKDGEGKGKEIINK